MLIPQSNPSTESILIHIQILIGLELRLGRAAEHSLRTGTAYLRQVSGHKKRLQIFVNFFLFWNENLCFEKWPQEQDGNHVRE